MEKESKSGPGQLSGNGLIAGVLLMAGVLFVRETPLETTRLPVSEPRMAQRFAPQDIDARLWQDPFGAIAKARAEARKRSPAESDEKDPRRSLANLLAEIKQKIEASVAQDLDRQRVANPSVAPTAKQQRLEVLAVVLPGGPYAETVESRRRARYAVLAGLNANRLAPAETEHLGYFFPQPPEPPQPEAAGPEKPVPPVQPIPFEWFESAPDARQRETDALRPLVLVLWVQSESFDVQPLRRMRELAQQFQLPGLSWRVLGPNGSDGLKAMVEEAAASGFNAGNDASNVPIRFYSPYATVPDNVLVAGWVPKGSTKTLAEFLADRHVMLVRTIGDDADLAKSLIEELALRGLVPSKRPPAAGEADDMAAFRRWCGERREGDDSVASHIAVVAEWDTLYGRSLRREFRATPDDNGFCVERFNYVRGLDGHLPASADGAAAAGSPAKPGTADKDAARHKDGSFIEIAEGQSQFDYLRRLRVQMHALDRQIRRTRNDGHGLRAIGVLGNDVHDKLLVLQALRPAFPHVIFFTTDMDARFLHPREQPWTRNLVVASSFGLRLADGLQNGTPPFRSGYQTAAFLATRIAMDDARRAALSGVEVEADPAAALPLSWKGISAWLTEPRMFEIGRTTAFDFTGSAVDDATPVGGRPECRGPRWTRECKDIHAPGSLPYPMPPQPVVALGLFLAMLALWTPAALMAWNARDRSKEATEARAKVHAWIAAHKALVAVLAAALVAVHIALPWVASCLWEPFAQLLTREKPMLAFEGISLWPTEAIRLLTLVLSCYLLYWGWLSLSRNLDLITYEFDSTPTRGELERLQREKYKGLRWWQKLADMFWPVPHENGNAGGEQEKQRWKLAKLAEQHKMHEQAMVFWNRHLVQNRLSARIVRTSVLVAIALLLSWIVMLLFGEHRFVPYRGKLSLSVHDNLRCFAVVMMYFIVFFVVDATVFCVHFVRGLRRLREDNANWPESTLQRFGAELRLPAALLDNWIDLRFIAMRTRAVTGLIYCPFIVISLWLLSRSRLFDNWTLEAGVLVPAAGGAAVALVCAILLRWGAEKSRKHALDQVKDVLIHVNASSAGAAVYPDVQIILTGSIQSALARAPAHEATDAQLRLLQSRIETLNEGAFAPLWQQPLLKAILLPFATLGGTTLLDYMALVNL